MEPQLTTRRHFSAALALGSALLMLILGETWLEDRLSPLLFVLYWTLCILLTVLAMVIAFRQLREIRRTTRHVQQELVEDTLRQIRQQAVQERGTDKQ